ncbi:2-keto-4-pentenoate hydratase [Brevibacterium moorei]|uniref:2-keto-4-pentenoate hydratase n=1 Tax=Brevibacterium moorei TaxID=2968457 RepID=UPI00211B989D|nr:fumarylacetoacetate hydrolase family protein [Brevibacterium sp. 68QC2CO]MCQ9385765.1 fumarylacetoacetate hydrolase family protein [Brevibacterium sp. 68QC2CO]
MTSEQLRTQTAAALAAAQTTRTGIAPVVDALGGVDDPAALTEAYLVQELVVTGREAATNPRVGRKVGLTSPAVQAQLGVDQPDFGVLLADMEIADAGVIDGSALIAPKVEAEVAFILGSEVTDASPQAVRAAVSGVVAALEIVDSRIRDWDITIVDTVADNASSALYVLGSTIKPLAEVDTAAVSMTTRINGTVASTGTGADCFGDPLAALVWVAQTALELGRPLQAGEVVLSGALGPMALLHAGDRIEAEIVGLGSVSATVSTPDSTLEPTPAQPEQKEA